MLQSNRKQLGLLSYGSTDQLNIHIAVDTIAIGPKPIIGAI